MMNYPHYGYQQNMMYGQAMPDQLQQMKQGYFGSVSQQPTDERIWVQGQNAAEAYLVAANGFVRLWDSSKPVFYEKRADASGRPSMEMFEYKRKGSEMPSMGILERGSINLICRRDKRHIKPFKRISRKTKEKDSLLSQESFSIPKRSHTDILYSRERVIATVFKPVFDFIPYISFTQMNGTAKSQ